MALVVEFLGLPGAGKTTVANKLKAQLKEKGFKVYSARSLFRHKVCDIMNLSRPCRLQFKLESLSRNRVQYLTKTLRNSLFSSFASKYSEYVRLCKNLIYSLNVENNYKRLLIRWLKEEGAGWELFNRICSDNVIYLNDEGFLHRAISYFVDIDPLSVELLKYIELAPKSNFLFYVKTPPGVALERLKKRNDHVYWHFDKMYGNNIETKYNSLDFLQDRISDLVAHKLIVVIVNEGNLERLVYSLI